MRSFSWSGMWRPEWPPHEVALRAALRQHGHEDLAAVRRAYLERDGKISFVLHSRRPGSAG